MGRVVAMPPHGLPRKEMHWPPQTTWFSEGKSGLAEGRMEFSRRQAGGQPSDSAVCEGEANRERGMRGGPARRGPHGLPVTQS